MSFLKKMTMISVLVAAYANLGCQRDSSVSDGPNSRRLKQAVQAPKDQTVLPACLSGAQGDHLYIATVDNEKKNVKISVTSDTITFEHSLTPSKGLQFDWSANIFHFASPARYQDKYYFQNQLMTTYDLDVSGGSIGLDGIQQELDETLKDNPKDTDFINCVKASLKYWGTLD